MKNIRIETIADMIKPGMVVADIGTDHAFLPILLVQNHICEKVYACDIAKGPLQAADTNIRAAGLSAKITTVLSNGFENVPSDADGAVIAGMGYYTAHDIMEAIGERLNTFRQIVVEVNRNVRDLRKWISDNRYTITEERAVYEKGHDYIIISINTDDHEPYSEEDQLAGTSAMDQTGEAYQLYVTHQIEKIDEILRKSQGRAANADVLAKEREIWSSRLK